MIKETLERKEIKNVYSVKDLNIYVRSLLRMDENLQSVWVRGEISGFTHYNDRHMYFDLKDEDSVINCAMFRAKNKNLDFKPDDGMEVLCRGDVSLYLPSGKYQLIINEMLPEGKGKLFLAYEKLKKKLSEEGLFDNKHKKTMPFYPEKIGIVTSEEADAFRDIISVARRRFPNIDIVLSPTPVQGKRASTKIVEAIRKLDNTDVDVIIVTRGGGSLEDLWNFNEEVVARAIFDAETPIISAVGHETDFMISDLVADLRAPTPSAAAEKVVPQKSEIQLKLQQLKERTSKALLKTVENNEKRLENIKSRPVFRRPILLLEDPIQKVDEHKMKIQKNIITYIKRKKQLLKSQRERLRALGPGPTLCRGYSVVLTEDSELINSVEEVDIEDILEIVMKDGRIKAKTKEVKRSKRKI